MKKNDIYQVHKLVLIPVVFFALVFLLTFYIYIYFENKNTKNKLINDINNEFNNNSSYFQQEIFLGQFEAYKNRFKSLSNFIESQSKTYTTCNILIINEPKAEFSNNCKSSYTNTNPDIEKDIIIGSRKIANIKVYLYSNILSSDVVNPVLISTIITIILAFLTHISLSKRIFKSIIDPIINKLLETERLIAMESTATSLAHNIRREFLALKMALKLISVNTDPIAMKRIADDCNNRLKYSLTGADGLIQNILRIGSKDIPEKESVCPKKLIESTLKKIFNIYKCKDINIKYTFKNKYKIYVNYSNTVSIVDNIVKNALEAMNFEGDLWFKVERSNKEFTKFTIGNSNSFIKNDIIKKLFYPFFTYGKVKGTGLGLALVKNIVESHGGKIKCESFITKKFPKGYVEFIFTLPTGSELFEDFSRALPQHSLDFLDK